RSFLRRPKLWPTSVKRLRHGTSRRAAGRIARLHPPVSGYPVFVPGGGTMSRTILNLILITGLAGASLAAHAQYVGPSEGSQKPSVKAILADPVDDQRVSVQG